MAYFNRDKSGGNRNFGKPRYGNDRPELFKATCANCGKSCEVPFKPSGSKPVLCRDCFRNNDSGDSRGFENKMNRQMYDAVCSNCGMDCKIPFRPSQGRDVLCSNCFEKNGPIDTRKPFEKQPFNREDRPQRTNEQPDYKAQFEALNAKMDKILNILQSAMEETPAEEVEASVVDEIQEEVTEEKPKKTAKKSTKKATASKKK